MQLKQPHDPKKDNAASSFIKYSSIGFQMLATIGLFAFVGYKIDQHQNNSKPIVAAILSLIGVVISLYQVIKQLDRKV